MMPVARFIAPGLFALCVVTSAGAVAAPLDRDQCKALEAEKRALLTPEVQAALARGPDWVKEHLHKAGEIEKIRQYLLVEEKVAFRCRTDGVVIPEPKIVPLPDRKPPVPTLASLLPLRKPALTASETASIEPTAGEGAGDVDLEPGASQAILDSDKTAAQ